MALEPCPNCSKRISPQAESCPRCGHPLSRAVWARSRQKRKRRAAVFLGSVVVLFVAGAVGLYIARSDASQTVLALAGAVTDQRESDDTRVPDSLAIADTATGRAQGERQQASAEAADAPTGTSGAGASEGAESSEAGRGSPEAGSSAVSTAASEPSGAGGRVEGGQVEGGRVEGGRVEGGRVEGGQVEGGQVEGARRTPVEAEGPVGEQEAAVPAEAPDPVNRSDPASTAKTASRPRPSVGQPSQFDTGDMTEGQLIRGIQRQLRLRGYDTGPVDGIYGRRTGSAIRTYQSDAGLAVTGEPSIELLQRLE